MDPRPSPAAPRVLGTAQLAALTLASLALLLLWDALGQDRAMARWFGDAGGFPWRDHWLLTDWLHDGAKHLSWVIVMVICVNVWWPLGWMTRVTRAQRLQLAVSILVSLLVVQVLKNFSRTSCPWDLEEFGGVAHYVSHWALGVYDGGGGRCFPGGHASAAFAYLAGYFALRRGVPGVARLWLAVTLIAGLVLGGAQQARGAHFMSHTLWTAWFCWTTAWLIDELTHRWIARGTVTSASHA